MDANIPALILGLDTAAASLVPMLTAVLVKPTTPGPVKALINILICLVYSIVRTMITTGGNFAHPKDYVWAVLYVMILSESLYARFKDQYQVFQDVGPISDKAMSFADAITTIFQQLTEKEANKTNGLQDPVEGKS